MAGFDYNSAKASGYSDAEIADFLGQQSKFDTAGARKAGYSDQEIIGHLTAQKPTPPATFGNTLAGEGDILATGAVNFLKGIPNAAKDIVQRIGGNDNPSPVFAPSHLGPSGQALVSNVRSILPSTENGLDVSDQELRETLDPTGKVPIEQLRAQYKQYQSTHPISEEIAPQGTVAGDLLHGAAAVGGDVANLAGGAALARAPVESVLGAVRTQAENASAPWRVAGFRNATGPAGATGRVLAGDTAKPALVNHNASVGNVIGASEAGIPSGTAPSYESLADARAAPGAVMDRVAAELPDNHALDATGRGGVTAAANPGGEGTVLSQAAQADVAAWRDKLLQPATGEQRINQLRTLRQEGFTQAGSDVVDQQQIGAAKLGMARALEENIGRDLPVGGSVDLQQFQDARKTLAKNYTWQSALRGNDFDLNAIARIQRAEPQLLDGATKTAADFANANREVVGLPTRLNAPGIATDLANTNPLHLGNLASAATLGAGPAVGRRLLTGGPSTLERTNRMFSAQPGRFTPLPSDVPPMPPGPPEPEFTTGVGANPNPAAPTGRPGDIPLADLLSHGVEREPAAGLTAGPMGTPAPSGIPFQVNAGHAAGDLSLAHEPSLADLLTDLRDHAAVLSQGVPEGTVARTAPRTFAGETVDYPSGQSHYRVNNASGESAASQEAINRGTRNVVQVDPDGNTTPVLRDVTQIDARAPKGHLLMDADTGEIIDRGGLNQRGAESLRNRAASRMRLGDTFVSR